MHLIGIGQVHSKPAAEIVAGDTLLWNDGFTSYVNEIVGETTQFIKIRTTSENGYTATRRLKKNRHVGVPGNELV